MKVIYSDIKSEWAIPEKKQTEGVEDITFLKTPLEFFSFFTLPLEIPDKIRG